MSETTRGAPPPDLPVRRRRTRQPSRLKRWVRKHRALSVLIGVAVVLLVVLLLWLWWLNRQLGELPGFDADREPIPAGEVRNILIIGTDDPVGRGDLLDMLESGEWEQGAFRSDAIMILHINGDRRGAQYVSIPRDSYVDVEGVGRTKINAAFSFGGPKLLTSTVEDLTGITIDHVAITDFGGFVGTTEAMGGVDVEVAEESTDTQTGKVWTVGPHHLEGENALQYVRQRYGLPRGDFDRVQRQQNFIRATTEKLVKPSFLANPVRVTRFVDSLDGLVAVDDALTPATIRALAFQTRRLDTSLVRYLTVPYTGTPTIEGAGSVVTLDKKLTRDMFAAISRDQWESWYTEHVSDLDTLPPEGEVQ